MYKNNTISPDEAFSYLAEEKSNAIDLRSEGEFEKANFKNCKNIAILNNEHRKLVGTKYKEIGSDEAEKLGQELVSGDYRENLINKWTDFIKDNNNCFLFCWRGGLRSKIAQEWISSRDLNIPRVEGGYKAIRNKALDTIQKKNNFIILSGMTGSGKTLLLKKSKQSVDLEKLANHRGSAFGKFANSTQPKQASFENNLALSLYQQKDQILLEDESPMIGRSRLPQKIYEEMSSSPMILLEVDRKIRASNIYEEYIKDASKEIPLEDLKFNILSALNKIQKKLGNQETENTRKIINQAFLINSEKSKEYHLEWIEILLSKYYDKLYLYSLNKKNRKTIFKGNFSECSDFIKKLY
ncbi:UNVERIFIED_CONTAM: hypothetical protein GTU68_051749 [Idotea baltica]|nr:hypothetical protein [Idotea baltica]